MKSVLVVVLYNIYIEGSRHLVIRVLILNKYVCFCLLQATVAGDHVVPMQSVLMMFVYASLVQLAIHT